MSGAFNIDVEVGKIPEKPKSIKIFCASLTDTWNLERNFTDLKKFHNDLTNHDMITKNKINLGKCPNIENTDGCELYLSRLGCTAAVLRIKRFHEFLEIPQSVRDGLTFASHKPFGKVVREGWMFRHPRFVRRGGGKRWICLTKEERGGSVICYKDANEKEGKAVKTSIISSVKIGASTEMAGLKDKGIPNAFVLKSGKRQWVLQAVSGREYQLWQAKLFDILKQFGPVTMNVEEQIEEKETATETETETADAESVSGKSAKSSSSPRASKLKGKLSKLSPRSPKQNAVNDPATAKLLRENVTLERKIKDMKERIKELAKEIAEYQDKEIELRNLEQEIRRKEQKNFQRQKEDLIAEYEVKQDNLRAQLEQTHQKMEQKTYDEGKRSGLKSLFGEDFIAVNIAQLEKGDVDEDGNFIDGDESSSGEESSTEEEAGAFGALGAIGGMGAGMMTGAVSGLNVLGDQEEEESKSMEEEPEEEEEGDSQEKKELKKKDDDEDEGFGDFKYMHKHLHRHDHKHIHDHRHTHIHDETGDEPVTYIQTHTIVHTITHTNTQFKIKKNMFAL